MSDQLKNPLDNISSAASEYARRIAATSLEDFLPPADPAAEIPSSEGTLNFSQPHTRHLPDAAQMQQLAKASCAAAFPALYNRYYPEVSHELQTEEFVSSIHHRSSIHAQGGPGPSDVLPNPAPLTMAELTSDPALLDPLSPTRLPPPPSPSAPSTSRLATTTGAVTTSFAELDSLPPQSQSHSAPTPTPPPDGLREEGGSEPIALDTYPPSTSTRRPALALAASATQGTAGTGTEHRSLSPERIYSPPAFALSPAHDPHRGLSGSSARILRQVLTVTRHTSPPTAPPHALSLGATQGPPVSVGVGEGGVLSPHGAKSPLDSPNRPTPQRPVLRSPQAASLEGKALYYLDYITHRRHEIRYGALQALYKLGPRLVEACPRLVPSLTQVLETYEDQEAKFTALVLQLLATYRAYSLAALPTVTAILQAPRMGKFRGLCCECMLAMGAAGIQALVAAAADSPEAKLESFVLTYVANNPAVQRVVLVPSLIRELHAGDLNRRRAACEAIGRLRAVAEEALDPCKRALTSGQVDRLLAARCIHALGTSGVRSLSHLLSASPCPRVVAAAALALGHGSSDLTPLRIVVNADLISQYGAPPRMVLARTHAQQGQGEDYLLFDPRELVSLVHQALAEGIFDDQPLPDPSPGPISTPPPFRPQTSLYGAPSGSEPPLSPPGDLTRTPGAPSLSASMLGATTNAQPGDLPVWEPSDETVRALVSILGRREPIVRIAAAEALAQIGAPQVIPHTAQLTKLLRDPESKVREAVAHVFGVIGPPAARMAVPALLPLVRDGFWKVRYCAVVALGKLGPAASESIPALLKTLKDGSVSRSEVCAALAHMGPAGERALLEVVQQGSGGALHMPPQARASAADGLALVACPSATIDQVVEALLVAAHCRLPHVRRAVLRSLGVLSHRARDTVTYLKPKNLLPFVYSFLKDSDKTVREMGAEVLGHSGPQGELLLIEGILKDSSPVIRASAAHGLLHVGPQSIRTLLLSLHDKDPAVKTAATHAVLSMGAQAIVSTLLQRPAQHSAVICAAQEILRSSFPFSKRLEDLLRTVIARLEGVPS